MQQDILDEQHKHTVNVDHTLVVKGIQYINNSKERQIKHQPYLFAIEWLMLNVGQQTCN